MAVSAGVTIMVTYITLNYAMHGQGSKGVQGVDDKVFISTLILRVNNLG